FRDRGNFGDQLLCEWLRPDVAPSASDPSGADRLAGFRDFWLAATPLSVGCRFAAIYTVVVGASCKRGPVLLDGIGPARARHFDLCSGEVLAARHRITKRTNALCLALSVARAINNKTEGSSHSATIPVIILIVLI